jgi:hypothetical protein
MEHQVALETGQTIIADMAEKHKNNSANLIDSIEPGNSNGGTSLRMEVSDSVKRKWEPTTSSVVSNDGEHPPVPVKLFRNGEQLQ